jgi:agmatinase
MEKPYEGFSTFLKAPIGDLSRRIGLMGLPYDGSNSFRPGPRFGPGAIRSVSKMLTDGHHPVFETLASDHLTDLGDVSVSNVDVAKSLAQIDTAVRSHPFYQDPDKLLMFIGGDHTISAATVPAIAAKHPGLAVVHFDAHADTWPDHFGDKQGHGTWVRDVIETGAVDPRRFISIGLRSPVDPETRDYLPNLGGLSISARGAMAMGAAQVVERIRHVVQGAPVYISLDIDSLDPAFAPGTGTPEIGGFSTAFLLDVLETMHGLNIVGMDVVEVSPAYDVAETTALAAATFLWTVASMIVR